MIDVKNFCKSLNIKLLDIGSVYEYAKTENKKPFATNDPILVFVCNQQYGHIGYVEKRKTLSLTYVM